MLAWNDKKVRQRGEGTNESYCLKSFALAGEPMRLLYYEIIYFDTSNFLRALVVVILPTKQGTPIYNLLRSYVIQELLGECS